MKRVKGWWFPDADEFMAKEMNDDGSYQAAHLAAALAYVKEFNVAVDGGAHVGTWSHKLALRFGHVIAFEPAADTREALNANMRQFGCENIGIMPNALSNQHEKVQMTLKGCPKEQQRKNTGARYMESGGGINAITLDSLALPRLDFLKLDIEGAEFKALCGARMTILRCKPVILFEDKSKCLNRFNVRHDDIYRLLTSLGYQHRRRVKNDEIWTPV